MLREVMQPSVNNGLFNCGCFRIPSPQVQPVQFLSRTTWNNFFLSHQLFHHHRPLQGVLQSICLRNLIKTADNFSSGGDYPFLVALSAQLHENAPLAAPSLPSSRYHPTFSIKPRTPQQSPLFSKLIFWFPLNQFQVLNHTF